MDDIKKSILATVAYYDVLDFPLKAGEIFDRLVNVHEEEPEIEADKLKKIVELVREGRLETMGGNYFLPGREYLVPLRLKKEKIWKLKIKKARRAVRWLHFLPYIKGVLASGSLATGNTDELSDLDVLIIAGHGRIWTARFLVTGLLELLGVRRRSWDKVAPDKICLNHYITDFSLLINLPSAYNAQTYINLKPIILNDGRLENRFKEENAWVLDHVKHWPVWDSGYKIENSFFPKIISMLCEKIFDTWLGDWLEKTAERYQERRIQKNPLTYIPGSRVSYSDKQLEFHPESPENIVLAKYLNRLKRLNLAR